MIIEYATTDFTFLKIRVFFLSKYITTEGSRRVIVVILFVHFLFFFYFVADCVHIWFNLEHSKIK